MKMGKMNQKSPKLKEIRKLAITRKKKKDLSKVTTKEFLKQDFKDDTDSDMYDDNDKKDKSTGIVLNIWIF